MLLPCACNTSPIGPQPSSHTRRSVIDHSVIDSINILQAALLAMQRAVEGLAAQGKPADHLLIDGNK